MITRHHLSYNINGLLKLYKRISMDGLFTVEGKVMKTVNPSNSCLFEKGI